MLQFNGMTIQPKIGTDFATQYGENNIVNGGSTMVNATNPAAMRYNIGKVTPNMDSSKIAEQLAKYDTAQPTPLPKSATREWIV